MVGFRMSSTAVVHLEYVIDFVRNIDLGIVADEFICSSPELDVMFHGIDKLLGRLHGVDIRDERVFAMKIWVIVTPESMVGVSEKIISGATASFLLGMLDAGNQDLK